MHERLRMEVHYVGYDFGQVPREVIYAARLTVDELKQELALTLFQQGKLSFGNTTIVSNACR